MAQIRESIRAREEKTGYSVMTRMQPLPKAAVFLDRDGTIIEDRGDLRHPDQVRFLKQTFPALRALSVRFPLFLVTNQGGVASGALTMAEVAEVNRYVADTLRREGVEITEIYVCPHGADDGCRCRKPSPWFLHQAADRYNLDLSKSFMVGDHPHDVRTGTAAGGTGIFVLTGHGQKHRHEMKEEARIVSADIGEVAQIIMAEADAAIDAGSVDEVSLAAHWLRRGRLVAFPTETVYGLGANAYDEIAVAAVFALKGRPRFDPLIVHVPAVSWLERLVREVGAPAGRLAEAFWPGPLTLVLPRRSCIPDITVAGLDTVAVRIPEHPLALRLLEQTGVPLAAPSANLFAAVSPTCFEHVRDSFGGKVAMILDGGACRVGVESTIIGFQNEQPILLRPGGISVERIEEALGGKLHYLRRGEPGEPGRKVVAPGMTRRHYSPGKPMRLFAFGDPIPGCRRERGNAALLLCGGRQDAETEGFMAVEKLSEQGDCQEMACNLFAALRRLQVSAAELIVAETAPDQDLGIAVNDRLRRAAAGEDE